MLRRSPHLQLASRYIERFLCNISDTIVRTVWGLPLKLLSNRVPRQWQKYFGDIMHLQFSIVFLTNNTKVQKGYNIFILLIISYNCVKFAGYSSSAIKSFSFNVHLVIPKLPFRSLASIITEVEDPKR